MGGPLPLASFPEESVGGEERLPQEPPADAAQLDENESAQAPRISSIHMGDKAITRKLEDALRGRRSKSEEMQSFLKRSLHEEINNSSSSDDVGNSTLRETFTMWDPGEWRPCSPLSRAPTCVR